jgi:hypothetical protein
MAKRSDELKKIFSEFDKNVQAVVAPLFSEMEFIEAQLVELKKKPFIKYHPKDPSVQKQTPAGKLYKELLAQEKDIVRILCSQLRKNDTDEESPLRKYLKRLNND